MRARHVTPNGMRRAVSVAAILASIAAAPAARAQGQKVAAEAMFDEGRKLMAQKKPELACPKFAESQRLDPSPSTLLNLGSCYEKLGKTATAWATYKEAASLASAQDRASLVTVATKHASALEPKLTRLAVRASAPVPGLVIKSDGMPIGEWDVAIPVDPGTHRIEASAPSKRAWATTAEVASAGETVTVTIPPLEDAPTPPVLTSADVPVATPEPAPRAEAEPSGEGSTHSPQQTIGIVTTSIGAAGLITGTVFLVLAKSKYDDSRDQCPTDKNLCTPEGVALRDDARTFGNVASFASIVGAAALTAGIVLLVTAPKHEPRRGGIRIAPTASGVLVDGRF